MLLISEDSSRSVSGLRSLIGMMKASPESELKEFPSFLGKLSERFEGDDGEQDRHGPVVEFIR
jgi:hypothetical protein